MCTKWKIELQAFWRTPSICKDINLNVRLGFRGQFHQTLFITIPILFLLYSIPGCDIAKMVCTCHDSTVVISCVTTCRDLLITIWVRVKYQLPNYQWKSVNEMGPWKTSMWYHTAKPHIKNRTETIWRHWIYPEVTNSNLHQWYLERHDWIDAFMHLKCT